MRHFFIRVATTLFLAVGMLFLFMAAQQLPDTIRLPDGSTSDPAWHFRNDVDSGGILDSDGVPAIVAAGTIQVRFNSAAGHAVDANGSIHASGAGNFTGGDFADANITNVGTIALDTIDNDGADVRITSVATVGADVAPDGVLHVHEASAGSVTAFEEADDLVVENDESAGISILTPASTTGYLAFGDADDNFRGGLIYEHNSDRLQLYAGNATRVDIDGTGNVGIGGDSSPDSLLEVSAGGGASDLFMLSADDAGDGDVLIVKNSGNVGIGTTSPGYPLDVVIPDDVLIQDGGAIQISNNDGWFRIGNGTGTSGKFQPNLRGLTNASDRNALQFMGMIPPSADTGTVAVVEFDARQDDNTDITSRHLFGFQNNGSPKMVIDKDGNVGIGTTSPDGTLVELAHDDAYLTLHNTTHENGIGSRESLIIFEGEDGSGTLSRLAEIRASASSAGTGENGRITLSVNDGNDGNAPSKDLEFDETSLSVYNDKLRLAQATGVFSTGDATPSFEEVFFSYSDPDIGYQNSDAANTSNVINRYYRFNSSTQIRTFYQERVTSTVTNDATRNSLVEWRSSNDGTFATALALDGTNVLIGTTTAVTGTNGKVLSFGDNGGNPTMGANVAGIFAKDVSGTVEMFAVGEDDVVTQLSEHAKDAPAHWYHDSDDVSPRIMRAEDPNLKCVEFIHLSRLAKTVERLTGVDVYHCESLNEYNARNP